MQCLYCKNEGGNQKFCASCGAYLAANDSPPPSVGPPADPSVFQGSPFSAPPPNYGQPPPNNHLPHYPPPYQPPGAYPPPPPGYNPYNNPYQQYPQHPQYSSDVVSANQSAMIALIFGILNFVILPFIGAIVALILGIPARKTLERLGQPSGAATAAMVLGIIYLALFGFAMLMMFFMWPLLLW